MPAPGEAGVAHVWGGHVHRCAITSKSQAGPASKRAEIWEPGISEAVSLGWMLERVWLMLEAPGGPSCTAAETMGSALVMP